MLKPGEIVERYVVEGELGAGGMAMVYRVRHRTLDTVHALKVLTVGGAMLRERLLEEGRAQARLVHPNIVRVTDVLDVRGSPGLLMEYVDGGSLEQRVAGKAHSLAEAEALFAGILAGVSAAHAAGMVHRDLKPANVLLRRSGRLDVPKVADFGLARLTADGGVRRTRTGQTMGTPAYMSPEQISNARDVDCRTDIFALGCILYELLAGRPAFDGDNIHAVWTQIKNGDWQPIGGVPARMASTIEGALAVRREGRIPDCATLGAVLAGQRWAPPENPSIFAWSAPSGAGTGRTDTTMFLDSLSGTTLASPGGSVADRVVRDDTPASHQTLAPRTAPGGVQEGPTPFPPETISLDSDSLVPGALGSGSLGPGSLSEGGGSQEDASEDGASLPPILLEQRSPGPVAGPGAPPGSPASGPVRPNPALQKPAPASPRPDPVLEKLHPVAPRPRPAFQKPAPVAARPDPAVQGMAAQKDLPARPAPQPSPLPAGGGPLLPSGRRRAASGTAGVSKRRANLVLWVGGVISLGLLLVTCVSWALHGGHAVAEPAPQVPADVAAPSTAGPSPSTAGPSPSETAAQAPVVETPEEASVIATTAHGDRLVDPVRVGTTKNANGLVAAREEPPGAPASVAPVYKTTEVPADPATDEAAPGISSPGASEEVLVTVGVCPTDGNWVISQGGVRRASGKGWKKVELPVGEYRVEWMLDGEATYGSTREAMAGGTFCHVFEGAEGSEGWCKADCEKR